MNNVYGDLQRAMLALFAAPANAPFFGAFVFFTDTSTTSQCSAYTTTDPAGAGCVSGNRSNIQAGPAVNFTTWGDRDPAIAAARFASARQLFDSLIAPTLVGTGTSKQTISGQSNAGVVGKITVGTGGTIGVTGIALSLSQNNAVSTLRLGTSNLVALLDGTSIVFGPGTLVAGDVITWLSLGYFGGN